MRKNHYEIKWIDKLREAEILYDINLNPLTNDEEYLPPHTTDLYEKHLNQEDDHITNHEITAGKAIYAEKEYFLERITTSCNQALIQPEDFEFIRTISIKRKNPYSVQSNRLD